MNELVVVYRGRLTWVSRLMKEDRRVENLANRTKRTSTSHLLETNIRQPLQAPVLQAA